MSFVNREGSTMQLNVNFLLQLGLLFVTKYWICYNTNEKETNKFKHKRQYFLIASYKYFSGSIICFLTNHCSTRGITHSQYLFSSYNDESTMLFCKKNATKIPNFLCHEIYTANINKFYSDLCSWYNAKRKLVRSLHDEAHKHKIHTRQKYFYFV